MTKFILDQKEAAKLKKGPHIKVREWSPVPRTSIIKNEPAATASFTKKTHLK